MGPCQLPPTPARDRGRATLLIVHPPMSHYRSGRMAGRLNMVLDLDAPEEPLSAGSTRAEQIAAMRRSTRAAKQRVLPLIEALRQLDPDLEILAGDSIFP